MFLEKFGGWLRLIQLTDPLKTQKRYTGYEYAGFVDYADLSLIIKVSSKFI